MADAIPAGKKSKVEKIKKSKITYMGDKKELLKKHPKLEKVIEDKATEGWSEVVVLEDGGIDCK